MKDTVSETCTDNTEIPSKKHLENIYGFNLEKGNTTN